MKSKIKLLVVGFVLSCILGLVGCTNVSMGTGIKLNSEATHSVVKTVNDRDVILAKNDNYLVTYNFTAGDLQGFSVDYLYTIENGSTRVEYVLTNDAGEVEVYTTYKDGASFIVDKDGNKTLSVYPTNDFTSFVDNFGFANCEAQTLDGELVFGGDTVRFSTKDVIGEEEAQKTVTFDYVVDVDTFLFTSAIYTLTDLEGTVVESAEIDFGYGVDVSEQTFAYDAIYSEADDALKFTLVVNPTAEDSAKGTYAVSADTCVEVDLLGAEVEYTFYKNYDCTKDIEDLVEYLTYYSEAKIYACPTKEQFSFDFVLTEADIENMNYLINNFIELGKDTAFFEDAEDARIMMEDKMEYFVHQYYIGQIKYYMDITREANQEAYNFAQDTYYDMYNTYIDAYKQVYESNSPYSYWLFADWTEDDLSILYADNEAITECESINSQLEQEFNALDQSSETWSKDVENIYERMVANNQKLAKLNGYENAYEYYSDSVFDRVYTPEERANLISYIKQYVVGFREKAERFYNESTSGLSQDVVNGYNKIMFENVKSLDTPYLGGYIKSFDGSLEEKMSSLFEKKLAKFALSKNSMGTAYANYSSYYEEGFTFFGKEYQDILTIVHEMGHYISFESYSLSDMGYDLAETHSQSNEWLFLNYLKDKIGKSIFDIILSIRLYNSMESIIRGMLVDEFEYRVYTAETPYTADDYADIMRDILTEFGFRQTFFTDYYTNYAQIVTILSPVYYLNYVTSELASIEFYLIAEDQGYETAQEVYRKLQEDVDITMSYAEILENIGLSGPFKEETYQLLRDVFFAED